LVVHIIVSMMHGQTNIKFVNTSDCLKEGHFTRGQSRIIVIFSGCWKL